MTAEGLPEKNETPSKDIDLGGCAILTGAGCLFAFILIAGFGLAIRLFLWISGIA